MPPPELDEALRNDVWTTDQDFKEAAHGFRSAQLVYLENWFDGEQCLTLRLRKDIERRLVRRDERSAAARASGKPEWWDSRGERVALPGLFGDAPGACFPMALRTFEQYLRIVEKGETLVKDLLELNITIEQADKLASGQAGGLNNKKRYRMGSYRLDVSE